MSFTKQYTLCSLWQFIQQEQMRIMQWPASTYIDKQIHVFLEVNKIVNVVLFTSLSF